MSNIVITEHDYTSAGNPQYTNFGVVVPGFVMKSYNEFITAADEQGLSLDDNGIIEFTTASDFEKVVGLGLKLYKGNISPIVPVVESLPNAKYIPTDYEDYVELHRAHGKTGAKDGYFYTFTLMDKASAGEDFKLGELHGVAKTIYHEDGNYFEYIGEEIEDNVADTFGDPLVDGDTYIGYAVFTKFPRPADEAAYETAISQAKSAPVLILIGNEGIDGRTISDDDAVYSFGNQYAYELLNLGYPVLYKILNVINYETKEFVENEAQDITTAEFWEPLKDRAVYDFRYLITGLIENNTEANNRICELASKMTDETAESDGRGDVIALADVDKKEYTESSNVLTQLQIAKKIALGANKISSADKFTGIFAPTVEYAYANDSFVKQDGSTTVLNKEFSGSFHYLMCAANSTQNNYNEWYANSGYNRGIGKYVVTGTPGVKLGDQAVKILQPRVITGNTQKAVNLIIKIRDNYYLWGNRTAAPLDKKGLKASHFLNIRQLCATLNKQIYATCKRFTFDPNSDVLWINFKNAIRPTLEAMKANQGIEDYNFELLPSTQKAELRARVQIVPIEAVEDFYIGIALVDSISDTTIIVTEA